MTEQKHGQLPAPAPQPAPASTRKVWRTPEIEDAPVSSTAKDFANLRYYYKHGS